MRTRGLTFSLRSPVLKATLYKIYFIQNNEEHVIHGYPIDGASRGSVAEVLDVFFFLHNKALVARGILLTRNASLRLRYC